MKQHLPIVLLMPCRFEVAEYRLAALNAELVSQELHGEVLHYTLLVTSL